MKAQNKLFLDTSRHFLKLIDQGAIRNLQLSAAVRVMHEEFRPDYPLFDESSFDDIAALMRNLYTYYDQWLVDNPNWQPDVTRYGMREESISFLEAYRKQADILMACGTAKGFDVNGLLRVMLTEFNPAYQMNNDDPDQPGKLVRDTYKAFLDRKLSSIPAAGKKKK